MKGRKWYSLKKELRPFITGTLRRCSDESIYTPLLVSSEKLKIELSFKTHFQLLFLSLLALRCPYSCKTFILVKIDRQAAVFGHF